MITRRDALLAAIGTLRRPYGAAWLRLDLESRRLTESNWPDATRPIAFGSVMKPFVALAFGAAHEYRYPEVTCNGCWKPDGHGRLSLIDALALSCNTYFLELARASSLDEVARVASTYGIAAPASSQAESWIGIGDGWRVAPWQLVAAFGELALRRTERGPLMVLRGMQEAARRGTAKAIQVHAYAKTGTGPCSHPIHGTGDGFAVALYPDEAPRRALLVRLHDQPGSEAARAAGDLIRTTS